MVFAEGKAKVDLTQYVQGHCRGQKDYPPSTVPKQLLMPRWRGREQVQMMSLSIFIYVETILALGGG